MSGAPDNPYVGPRSIRAGEPLYGRDREVAQLFDLLLAERVVLLYSPSGAGKSSLLNAGLLPRLREEGFRVRPTMRVGMEPPGDAPAGVNRHVLSALLSLEDDAKDGAQDLAVLAGTTLAAYLERSMTGETDAPEVLLLDQFEEILTTAPTEIAAKRAFFAELGAALRDERRWLIVAMREDFIAGLDPYRGAVPTGLRTTFRLDLLGEAAALAAIKGPAAAAGVAFLDVAAEKLANDLRQVRVPQPDGSVALQLGPHVEPVQLQVVCRSLWQRRRPEDREIGLADLGRLGDVDAALATYYDAEVEAAAQLASVPEHILRQWISRHLVTGGGLRTQVLQTPERTLELANAALVALVDAHLLRTDSRRGMTWFELAHDRIVRPLQESNARWFQAKLSPVQRQAELWDSRGRPESLLLATHEEASRLLAAAEARSTSERLFLEQSREVRQRQAAAARNRLLLRILTLVVAALVVAWLAIAYVLLERGAARELAEAEARTAAAEAKQRAAEAELPHQLVAQAALYRTQQPELAALLGVAAAARFTDPWQRKAALMNVEATAPHLVARVSLAPPGGLDPAGRPAAAHPWQVAWTRGELYALDRSGQVSRIDLATRGAAPLLPPGLRAVAVAAHPSEPLLAIGRTGGRITLWDPRDGREVGEPISLPGEAPPGKQVWTEGLMFSADGRSLLATRGMEGALSVGFVVDLATRAPRRLGTLVDVRDPSDLALSADGQLAVAAAGLPNGTIFVYSGPQLARSIKKLACRGPCPMHLARFSPDGARLFTGGDGVIALWSVAAGQVGEALRVVQLPAGQSVRDALFMRDGKLAVLAETRISLWNGATLEPWGTPIEVLGRGVHMLGEAGEHGELIAAASQADAPIHVYDPRRLAPRGVTPVVTEAVDEAETPAFPFTHARVLAAIDPSGAVLATTDFTGAVDSAGASTIGHVTLHDPAGARPEQRLPALPGKQFAAMVFASGGARLVVADVGGAITAWDVAAGAWTRLGGLSVAGHEIGLGVDARGEVVAAVRTRTGLALGREVDGFAAMTTFGDRRPTAVAFDGLARRVVVATCAEETRPGMCSRSNIDLHDVAAPAGPRLQRLEVGFAATRVVVSANGARLAASDDQRVRVWDLPDGAPRPLTVRDDLGKFNGLDLSGDGVVLVASAVHSNAAVDLELWNLDTGEELAPPLRAHSPAVGSTEEAGVSLSRDGRWLVSSTCDGVVAWDIDDAALRGRACALAGRELTPGEHLRFFGEHRPYQTLCRAGE